MNKGEIDKFIIQLTCKVEDLNKIKLYLYNKYNIDIYSGILKYSSGKSILLIYEDKVVKIFPNEYDIEKEIEILKKIDCKYIIKLIDYNCKPNYILYNRLFMIETINSKSEFIKQLQHISLALHQLHKNGYYHDDVFSGNIGLDDNKNYILYDFETASKITSNEQMFQDILMYIEDAIIIYKNNEDILNIINFIYKEILKFRTVYDKKILFLGKETIRKVYSYSYSLDDFIKIIDNIL